MNQKDSFVFSSLVSFLTTWLFWVTLLIDDVIPWEEFADDITPHRSVYRFKSHFITSLKESKDKKQKQLWGW